MAARHQEELSRARETARTEKEALTQEMTRSSNDRVATQHAQHKREMDERVTQLERLRTQISVLDKDTQSLRKRAEVEANEKHGAQQETATYRRALEQARGNFQQLQAHVSSQEAKFKRDSEEKIRELSDLKQRYLQVQQRTDELRRDSELKAN